MLWRGEGSASPAAVRSVRLFPTNSLSSSASPDIFPLQPPGATNRVATLQRSFRPAGRPLRRVGATRTRVNRVAEVEPEGVVGMIIGFGCRVADFWDFKSGFRAATPPGARGDSC